MKIEEQSAGKSNASTDLSWWMTSETYKHIESY